MNKTYRELCDENQHLREGIRAAATKLDARELRVTVTTDPDLQALDHAINLSRTDRDDALDVAIKSLNAALLARNNRPKRDAQVANEADKKGFIAGCVYAASMLYPAESVGATEMLKAAITQDELSLGSEYDLKRLIEERASADIPGLHRAWQIAKRREKAEGGES